MKKKHLYSGLIALLLCSSIFVGAANYDSEQDTAAQQNVESQVTVDEAATEEEEQIQAESGLPSVSFRTMMESDDELKALVEKSIAAAA